MSRKSKTKTIRPRCDSIDEKSTFFTVFQVNPFGRCGVYMDKSSVDWLLLYSETCEDLVSCGNMESVYFMDETFKRDFY